LNELPDRLTALAGQPLDVGYGEHREVRITHRRHLSVSAASDLEDECIAFGRRELQAIHRRPRGAEKDDPPFVAKASNGDKALSGQLADNFSPLAELGSIRTN
jgi:hypothetical protein